MADVGPGSPSVQGSVVGDSPSRRVLIGGLLIAASAVYLSPALRLLRFPWHIRGAGAIRLGIGIEWLIAVVIVIYVLRVERQPPRSLGLNRPRLPDLTWPVAFAVAWLAYVALIAAVRLPGSPNPRVRALAELSGPVKAVLILTAAVVEEILFRGYMLERIGMLTRRLWLGALVSSLVFIAPHVAFYGSRWLLVGPVTTALLVLLYVWRRNLFACMVFHLIVDAPLLLVHGTPRV